MMMDDSAPTHKRRKLVKIYKNVLSRKRTVVAEVSSETYFKNWDKIEVEKQPQMYSPLKLKGNTERERGQLTAAVRFYETRTNSLSPNSDVHT